MVAFNITPLSRFESGQTSIKRPREFLYFSFDDEHKSMPLSDDSLRYYYPPFIPSPGTPVAPVNLSKGFDDWAKADDSIDNHLDGLLETIQVHEENLVRNGTKHDDIKTKVDIVTWRGMMTKIMTAPFDIFSDFEMNATYYQGTIYIEENYAYGLANEQERKKRPLRRGENPPELMQYWGYKFETLSVLKKPWAECSRKEIDSRSSEIVNNNSQYCSIARTGIGNTALILGGEVDCILGEKPSNPDEPIPWVELKTSAEPPNNHPREAQKYERKLLKFWAQSFLLGVPKIIVGFRTQDGYLTHIKELETQRIPGQVSRGEGMWNGNVCINMTGAFLDFLKMTIMGQDGVWRIKRKKNDSDIKVFKVQENGTGEILRASFKTHREKLLAAEIVQKLGGMEPTKNQL